MCIYFFFFKQKTAYEMRISDWSSDVCSSDLVGNIGLPQRMTLKEGIDPRASFGIEQRASDIDDPPARPHQPRGKIEQIILRRRKPAQPFGSKPPLGLGLAPPGAGSRTRRIDQYAIDLADEIGKCRKFAPGIAQQHLDRKSTS